MLSTHATRDSHLMEPEEYVAEEIPLLGGQPGLVEQCNNVVVSTIEIAHTVSKCNTLIRSTSQAHW